ncbi:hypothetical protein AVEN_95478-1, partial [Araneus ventricosus]
FFSSLQIYINVDPGLILFIGKIDWLFNGIRIIFLFGPDETYTAKAIPYSHIRDFIPGLLYEVMKPIRQKQFLMATSETSSQDFFRK